MLEVTATGMLGTGDVSLSDTSILRLGSATSIDDASNLSLASSGSAFALVDLNFSNSQFETVNTLTINGVGLEAGIYNATNLPNYLTGTGNLLVAVPEPGSTMLVAAGALLLLVVHYRRRQGGSR